MEIKKAVKSKQKLRIALAGASGSGKTYSSLMLATSLGCKKIGVIDTERGSSQLYADKFDFDILELEPPYNPLKFVKAINTLENANYDCIIIDSITHEWQGAGGCLEMVSNSSNKNSYTAWGAVTPLHQKFLDAMISSTTHIIVTMRAKTAYDLVKNDKGKLEPVKKGTEPQQRDGIEYEFTMVFDLDQNHKFTCSKDRTGLFDNPEFAETLDKQVGTKILDWLNSGTEIKPKPKSKAIEPELPKETKTFLEWQIKLKEPMILDELKLYWKQIQLDRTKMLPKEFDELEKIKDELKNKLTEIKQ
jgi:hypothetical protein